MTKTTRMVGTAVRKKPAERSRRARFWPFILLIAIGAGSGAAPQARADVESIGVGAGAAVPLGTAYLNYGRYPTFTGDVILNGNWMLPNLRLIGTAEMSVATLNNTTTQQIRIWDYGVYVGFRYESPGENATIRPYASLQVGGVYAVMGFNGVSTGVQNTGVEFAGRFVPGFEAWLSPKFGVDFGFPVEYLAVQNSLFLWDAVFSLRFKL